MIPFLSIVTGVKKEIQSDDGSKDEKSRATGNGITRIILFTMLSIFAIFSIAF